MIKPSKELLEHFKIINGAFSVTEAVALYNILLDAPNGVFCELVVAHGKSAVIMVSEMRGNEVVLVDPEFKDPEWLKAVVANISNVLPRKIHLLPISDYSTNVLPEIGLLAYCMVDSGSHQDGLPLQEVKMLEDKILPNGIIAFHDFDSQFKEVREAYEYLVSTGKYVPIVIGWEEIIEWVNSENMEQNNQSWHHPELRNPCFLGALKKV